MHDRDEARRQQDDQPRVIAISATKQQASASLFWGLGLAGMAYVWALMLLQN